MKNTMRLVGAVTSMALVSVTVDAAEAQQLPQTWQEQNNFHAGPTPFEPLMEFWFALDEMSDLVSMQPLTHTLLDREMVLVLTLRRSSGYARMIRFQREISVTVCSNGSMSPAT